MSVNKPKKRQRGAAAVELALVMPIFLVLVTGTFTLGLTMYHRFMLQNALATTVRTMVWANLVASAGLSSTTAQSPPLVVSSHHFKPSGGFFPGGDAICFRCERCLFGHDGGF